MKRMLTVVVVLQVVQLVGQWTGTSFVAPAQAQIPDSAAIRVQMLDEIKTTNAKLDKLIDLLESGHVQVSMVEPKSK
jgi:hypothetical protein